MRRSLIRNLTLAGLLLAIAFGASSCNRDCVACQSFLVGPEVNNVAFELCVSRLPAAETDEERCAAIEVRYVEISDD